MPENKTLIARVTEALEAAQNGTLTRSTAKSVLADVLVHLQATPAGADQLAPEVVDRIGPALGTLSYSEREAMKHIFNELEGTEGILVASKIADAHRVTRSVIVNGLRKFESAGIIEATSLGMKGTRIKVLVPDLKRRLLAS